MKILDIKYITFSNLFTQSNLPIHYFRQEGSEVYNVWAMSDDHVIATRTTASSEIDDFETNHKDNCTLSLSVEDSIVLAILEKKTPLVRPYQSDRSSLVSLVGREGSETIWATHNYADRTTWFGDSVRVTGSILFNSGDNLTFSGSHQYWIDMAHGKIFDEDSLCEDVSHGYAVTVIVNNITQSMRTPFATSGGDYEVNYTSGSITFASPVTSSVTCSYSYENGSTWYLRPVTGKAIDIEDAEAQFSQDIVMNDTIYFGVWGPVQVFAPQYWQGNGGPFPTNYMIELDTTIYKTIFQMIDEAMGSYPVIPPIGGPAGRGMVSPIYGFPFKYNAVRRLFNKYGMELRVNLVDNQVYDGDRATATFYCVSRNESDLE